MNSLRSNLSVNIALAAILGAFVLSSDLVYWALSKSLFEAGRQSFISRNYEIAEILWTMVREGDKSRCANPDSDIEHWNMQLWLGVLKMKQGRLLESEELMKDALRISQNIKLPGYYVTPHTMRLLSNLYDQQHLFDEADRMLEEAERLQLDYQRVQTVKTI
ncbi:MAG: tetratricopeptide repeat protein [Candidatus Melainabacteria bacterium]|nr:tetratricopeptide repeat protein [Candidatus Melainabacteria bacterium]